MRGGDKRRFERFGVWEHNSRAYLDQVHQQRVERDAILTGDSALVNEHRYRRTRSNLPTQEARNREKLVGKKNRHTRKPCVWVGQWFARSAWQVGRGRAHSELT